MKINNIPYICEYISDREYPEINNISSDPSELTSSCAFVLTKKSDGSKREFTLKVNPAVIICEKNEVDRFEHPYIIPVDDARQALSFGCASLFSPELRKINFFAITGTNGKTTTAYTLYSIFKAAGKKAMYIGTGLIEILGKRVSDDSYSMTTPDPEMLYRIIGEGQKRGVEYAVIEASSHAITLKKLSAINFTVTAFTNLSPEHLDFHKTMNEYLDAKLKILKNTDKAIINIDDRYFRCAANRGLDAKLITVGAIFDADIKIHTVKSCGLDGFSFIYATDKYSLRVNCSLPGIYNIYNTALAIACATSAGIKPCIAKKAVSEIKGIKGRFEIINDVVKVIIDYAHTPYAMQSFLSEVRKSLSGKSKLICVFGCGGERDKSKRPEAARIAEEYSDLIIVTDDNSRNEDPKKITEDIIRGFSDTANYKIIHRRSDAIKEAILGASIGDFVAIIGKGAEEYNIDADGYHCFNERTIISAAIEEKRRCCK